jgi:hypothetical protein
MNVNPDALRKEVIQTLREVEASISVAKQDAKDLDIQAEKLRDHWGTLVMPQLLLAKAQCLDSLIRLNEPSKR